MENLIKQQRRVAFSESGQRKVNKDPIKENKSQNWFQRQLYRQTSQDYDSTDSDFAAAIAAATFAVHSCEEEDLQRQKKAKTNQEGSFRQPESGRRLLSSRSSVREPKESAESSVRSRMGWGNKAPSFTRPISAGNNDISLTRRNSVNSKVDEWEKAEMIKIQKRYEKRNLAILGWENEKKTRAKSRIEAKKNELEQRRAMNWQHYQSKLARIDHIAGGARVQAEEIRREEEIKVKDRAKKMRAERVVSPLYCFCC